MAINLYNTLARQKEPLVTREMGKVAMYVCGPTPYDYPHIGNARTFVAFDTIRRYLEYSGYEVTYVQNFTDIDDKIIKRANEQGIATDRAGRAFHGRLFRGDGPLERQTRHRVSARDGEYRQKSSAWWRR